MVLKMRFLQFLKFHFKKSIFLKVDILLLHLFGLWPHQPKFKKQLNLMIFLFYCTSLIIVFAIGLLQNSSTDKTVFIETLMCVISVIGGLLQYYTLFMKSDLLKSLYSEIDTTWHLLRDANEVAIFKKCYFRGSVLAFIFIGIYTVGASSFTSLALLPRFFRKNESEDYSRFFPYYAQSLLINKDNPNLQIVSHATLGSLYVCSMYPLVTAVFAANVTRICAIYSITSCRLESLIDYNKTNLYADHSDAENIIAELICITSMHKKAIKATNIISEIFSNMFFGLQVCLVLSSALFLFEMVNNIMSIVSITKLAFITIVFIECQFCMNYGGEQIYEFSNSVLLSTYNMPWYLLSIKARKMLLIIMQRSSKSNILTAGITKLSLENFTSIIKMTYSLTTVLLSTNTE